MRTQLTSHGKVTATVQGGTTSLLVVSEATIQVQYEDLRTWYCGDTDPHGDVGIETGDFAGSVPGPLGGTSRLIGNIGEVFSGSHPDPSTTVLDFYVTFHMDEGGGSAYSGSGSLTFPAFSGAVNTQISGTVDFQFSGTNSLGFYFEFTGTTAPEAPGIITWMQYVGQCDDVTELIPSVLCGEDSEQTIGSYYLVVDCTSGVYTGVEMYEECNDNAGLQRSDTAEPDCAPTVPELEPLGCDQDQSVEIPPYYVVVDCGAAGSVDGIRILEECNNYPGPQWQYSDEWGEADCEPAIPEVGPLCTGDHIIEIPPFYVVVDCGYSGSVDGIWILEECNNYGGPQWYYSEEWGDPDCIIY